MMNTIYKIAFWVEIVLCLCMIYSIDYIVEIYKYCINDKSIHGLTVCISLSFGIAYIWLEIILKLKDIYVSYVKNKTSDADN